MDPSKSTSCSRQCFLLRCTEVSFTDQLHLEAQRGVRSQDTHYCANTQQKPDKDLVTVHRDSSRNTGQLEKRGTGGGCSSDTSCLLLLRDGRGTAGPRHTSPHGNIPLAPLVFCTSVIFLSEFCPAKKLFNLDTQRTGCPLTGTKEMVLATPGKGPAGPSSQLLFANW